MAVYDTPDNGRSEFTRLTLGSVWSTVNWGNGHRLVVIDNNSCDETKNILRCFKKDMKDEHGVDVIIIDLPQNLGTAKAINQALKLRHPGEYCIKIDNDVVIHKTGWVDDMEDVMRRMPSIGILGLKRDDLCESTYSINPDQRSKLIEVPHDNSQRWRVVEECKHVMGTCTMLSPALLDRIGYFYQMDGLYGFDDSLLCVRSTIAGYLNCFLLGIDIDHIDPGGTEYTDWKAKYAGEMIGQYAEAERAYKSGMRDIYYNPFETTNQ
jgi:GT2 family glycosyltransferase